MTRQGAAVLGSPIMAMLGFQDLVTIIALAASEIGGGKHQSVHYHLSHPFDADSFVQNI